MRRFAFMCCAAVVYGCTPSDDQTDTAADSAAVATPAPAAISLADVAGTWNVEAKAENSDSVLVRYQLFAQSDTAGWTMKLGDRPDAIPVRVVVVEADSIVTDAGPYASILRPGVTVTTRSVSRLQGGRLVGRTVARYTTTGPDSVLNIRTEGTRVQ